MLLTIIRKYSEISVSGRKSFWIVKLTTIDYHLSSTNPSSILFFSLCSSRRGGVDRSKRSRHRQRSRTSDKRREREREKGSRNHAKVKPIHLTRGPENYLSVPDSEDKCYDHD